MSALPAQRSGRRVLVVGAGLAGLAAAWRLAERGLDPLVIERRCSPGGRAAGERVEGFALEAVPSLVWPGDRHLLGWIRALGLTDELLPLHTVTPEVVHRGRVSPAEVRSCSDVRRVPGVRWVDALRLRRLPRLMSRYAHLLDLSRPERAAPLDDRSIADFARLYFGRSVAERWMGPLDTCESLGSAQNASRVQLLQRLRTDSSLRPGLLRAPLVDLVDRAAASLRIRTGVEALALEARDGMCVLTEGAGSVSADAVIVATPAPEALRLAANVLAPAERALLARARYAHGITLAAGLAHAVGARPRLIRVPHVEASSIEAVLVEPGRRGGRVPESRGLALVRTTAAFAESHFSVPEETLAKELLGALARIVPALAAAVSFTRVLRLETAAPRFEVGRYRELARFQRLQQEARAAGRRVYFAGDHLAHPSWEGAVASGCRAADAVVMDLGVPQDGRSSGRAIRAPRS